MVRDNKSKENFVQFHRNAVKFQLFFVVALSDRAKVKGDSPATAVLSGQKVALIAGTVMLSVPRGHSSCDQFSDLNWLTVILTKIQSSFRVVPFFLLL